MIRPDQVWRCFYCCAVALASSYLTYVAARRYYHLISTDAYMVQYTNRVDNDMVVYFTLLGCHVAAIFFFCVFSFVSSRNFANDGRCFGNAAGCLSPRPSSGEERVCTYERRVHRLREKLHLLPQVVQVRPLGQQIWQNVIRSWQHFLPLSSVLHLASAYCLLLSQTVVKRSCIAAVVTNSDRKSKVLPADVSMALKQLTDTELDLFFDRSVFFALPSLGTNSSDLEASKVAENYQVALCFDKSVVPLEFCNYVVSLLVLVFRYCAVVFCANRLFALLLGAALVLQSVTAMLDYEAVSVLYRIDCCTHIRVLFLNVSVTALLITFGNCVMFIACVFIFEYSWKRMRRSLREQINSVGQQQFRSASEMQSLRVGASVGDCRSPSGSSFSNWYQIWREFSTHFHAHLLFVVGIILKIPYFWDLVVYYRNVGDALFLTAIFVNAVDAFCWTAIWFLLTVTRNNWHFKILPPNHDGVPPCTRSCTVATILSTTSIRMGESVHETELTTDNGLQQNLPLPVKASEYSQPTSTSCIYAKPNTLKFTAQSSKQSLKRKSILRSATQPEFPHANVASRENGPTHIHDQFDRVTLKINNPVTVISDATAGSSSPTVEPSFDYHHTERSSTCGRQTKSFADTAVYQTGQMGIKGKSNTMMVRIQTPTESVSSDSGCLPQSGPASSSASKRLTPATATVLPLRIASPSLPSPTSFQSGLTSDLTNAASGPETGYTAGTETDASQSGSGNGDTIARNRPPSLIVDCPMHGYVYWPLQNTSELVYSEV